MRDATIVALAAIGVGVLYYVAYQYPFWHIRLEAPQYPDGLQLTIFLDHVEGRVREINGLNHYIGMAKLQSAATLEKALAPYAVGFAAFGIALFLFGAGRKRRWLAFIPAVLFPVGFFADLFGWMYYFGHSLDPRAPINIDSFTPTVLGPGTIGQFRTVAQPGTGFYVASAAILVIAAAWWARRSICQRCPHRQDCSNVCPRLVVRSADTVADDQVDASTATNSSDDASDLTEPSDEPASTPADEEALDASPR
jgi:hypothetical protein